MHNRYPEGNDENNMQNVKEHQDGKKYLPNVIDYNSDYKGQGRKSREKYSSYKDNDDIHVEDQSKQSY